MVVRTARVTGVLSVLIIGGLAAGALAVWSLVAALRDQPVRGVQIPAMAAVELILVIQTVLVAVGESGGGTQADPALLWGYVVTQLLLVPVAFGWAFVERTRWSSVVLAVAAAVVVVLQVRIWQIWQG